MDVKSLEGGKRRGVLRNVQDLHCIAFHLVCLVAYAVAWWLYFHPRAAGVTGPWSRAAFIVACAFLLGWSTGIDLAVVFHNHAHRKFFRSRFLNRWLSRLWTFSGGWPSYWWEHFHLAVHHRYLLGPGDWSIPKLRPDGSTESIHRYALLHWPWRYNMNLVRDFAAGRGSASRAVRELIIFLALWSIPFWIDPWMALWLWVLPQWIANVLVAGPGMYVQHVGCEAPTAERPFAHSNNFLGHFFSLTMFDSGPHIEHHDHPNTHWTELHALHRKIRPHLGAGGGRTFPFGFFHGATRIARLFRPTKGYRNLMDAAFIEPEESPAPASSPGPSPSRP